MVYAYIAHKEGYLGGVVSAEIPAKNLAKYLASFIKAGCDIKATDSAEEYLANVKTLKPWRQSPFYKAKK
jgi:hypothetical protein